MTLSSRTTTVLAVLLVASLAVNFFVAGMAFSRHDRPHFRMTGGGSESGIQIRRAPGGLSAEGMEILRRSMRGQGDRIRQHAEAMSEAQESIRAALRARPFDPQALADAQKEMRDAVDAIQSAMQANIAGIAAKLSDEDRAALANMPVQSPLVVFRREMLRRDFGPERRSFGPAVPLGASPPPAPGEER